MKVREVVSLITRNGWVPKNQEGSHKHYVHPSKPGKMTVVGSPGDDIAEGTLRSILRQAQISKKELLEWKKRK